MTTAQLVNTLEVSIERAVQTFEETSGMEVKSITPSHDPLEVRVLIGMVGRYSDPNGTQRR